MLCPDCNKRVASMRGLCRKCHHARRDCGSLPPAKKKGYSPKYSQEESAQRELYRRRYYALRRQGGYDLPPQPDYVTPLPTRQRPPEDRSGWTSARWRKYLYNQWYARCQRLRELGTPESEFPTLDYGIYANEKKKKGK